MKGVQFGKGTYIANDVVPEKDRSYPKKRKLEGMDWISDDAEEVVHGEVNLILIHP